MCLIIIFYMSWWLIKHNQIWYAPTLMLFLVASLGHWNRQCIKLLEELVESPAAPSPWFSAVWSFWDGAEFIEKEWKVKKLVTFHGDTSDTWWIWHMVIQSDIVHQNSFEHSPRIGCESPMWSCVPVDRSSSGMTWLLELIQSLGHPSDAKSLGAVLIRAGCQHESNMTSFKSS